MKPHRWGWRRACARRSYALKLDVACAVLRDGVVSRNPLRRFADDDNLWIRSFKPRLGYMFALSAVVWREKGARFGRLHAVDDLFHETGFQVAHPNDDSAIMEMVFDDRADVAWLSAVLC